MMEIGDRLKNREWFFNRLENGTVYLLDESGTL
jgi:hypothetical protein